MFAIKRIEILSGTIEIPSASKFKIGILAFSAYAASQRGSNAVRVVYRFRQDKRPALGAMMLWPILRTRKAGGLLDGQKLTLRPGNQVIWTEAVATVCWPDW